MPQPEPVDLVFQVDRETKSKIRFSEMSPVSGDNKTPEPVSKEKAVVEKLYVSKTLLKKWGNPDTLHVRITAP